MTTLQAKTYRFTRDEYYQMADLGFFRDRRVELIAGEIVEMAPQQNSHFLAINLVTQALAAIFPAEAFWVRAQGPLHLGEDSDPEPDVALVPDSMRTHHDHPTSALLVVEVAETSLAFDRTTKAALYARANIPDYWILNLPQRQLEVHRDPSPDGYRSRSIRHADDSVSPLAQPKASIPIADLLP